MSLQAVDAGIHAKSSDMAQSPVHKKILTSSRPSLPSCFENDDLQTMLRKFECESDAGWPTADDAYVAINYGSITEIFARVQDHVLSVTLVRASCSLQ
jgi:hypothetical protein